VLRSPHPIVPGARARVISPAWPAMYYAPQRARRAEKVLRGLGIEVEYGRHAWEVTDDGLSAGSARHRAADFMDAFTDAGVDLVISAGGGASSHELLPLLDPAALRLSCRPFVGNSDNVWLNHFLYQEAGLISYYGVTHTAELGEPGGMFPETLDHLRRALAGSGEFVCKPVARRTDQFYNWQIPEQEKRVRNLTQPAGCTWLRPGRGSGPLVGGELSAFVDMVDHFRPSLDGCVVFWDIGLENPAGPVELLSRLADRVPLTPLAGMMVGPRVGHDGRAWVAAVEEALRLVAPAAQYPVVVNADVGHLDPRWVVPYGADVTLDSERGIVFPRDADPSLPGGRR
jgi:muramoyltetrapeptide carboxypeptidase LdcA involved in peptidoglycan recycling